MQSGPPATDLPATFIAPNNEPFELMPLFEVPSGVAVDITYTSGTVQTISPVSFTYLTDMD